MSRAFKWAQDHQILTIRTRDMKADHLNLDSDSQSSLDSRVPINSSSTSTREGNGGHEKRLSIDTCQGEKLCVLHFAKIRCTNNVLRRHRKQQLEKQLHASSCTNLHTLNTLYSFDWCNVPDMIAYHSLNGITA